MPPGAALLLLLLAGLAPAAAYDNGAPRSRLPPLGWSSWEAFGPGTEHPIRDYCDRNSVMARFDTDYGKAQSVCREAAPAVFERSYEKAHVSLNCSSWVASIKMKA